MKSPRQIGRILMTLVAALAIGYTSFPCLFLCETAPGEVHEDSIIEAHCACSHGGGTLGSSIAVPFRQADSGAGCACVISRTPWAGQVVIIHRGNSEQETLFAVGSTHFFPVDHDKHAAIFRQGNFHTQPPLLNQRLMSLRTVVLLT